MKITVFGASGKVGRLLVIELLDRGYEVIAFVHRQPVDNQNRHLHTVQGDIHNSNDVAKAIEGADVVISTLGSWGTKSKDIVSSGTENIISGMKKHNVKRLITLTGSDARAANDTVSTLDRLTHSMIMVSPARKIMLDGEGHVSLLEGSDLNWTTLRSPIMNNSGDPKQFIVNNIKPRPWSTVNRKSVALAMLSLINDTKSYQQAPFIKRSTKG